MSEIIEASEVLDSLEANEDLRALSVESYPHMKSGPRQKMYRALVKKSKLNMFDKKPVSLAEMARLITQGG